MSRTIGVLGYGNQGRAQALNLRDRGLKVLIGQRPGASYERAMADCFEPMELDAATKQADILLLSLPDVAMGAILQSEVLPAVREGQTLLVAHGFSLLYGLWPSPPGVDVALVSPKGAGAGVRALFESGGGVPALVGVHQDSSGNTLQTAVDYAAAIGCDRSGLILQTTLKDETETDLFGEQAVLCGGIPALIEASYQTLVARGYPEEMAYFECLHETKLVVDLLVARGIAGMRQAISDTAAYGGLVAGRRIVGDAVKGEMAALLDEIQSGEFAKQWIHDARNGKQELARLMNAERLAGSEQIGRTLRAEMNRD